MKTGRGDGVGGPARGGHLGGQGGGHGQGGGGHGGGGHGQGGGHRGGHGHGGGGHGQRGGQGGGHGQGGGQRGGQHGTQGGLGGQQAPLTCRSFSQGDTCITSLLGAGGDTPGGWVPHGDPPQVDFSATHEFDACVESKIYN